MGMNERQLFVFWQFNGDNKSYCQLHCPECYGHSNRTYQHYWNGNVAKWEKAFERLNRDIYFVFSYGEALLSHGFYECVDMIGRHPNWTLCIITNLMASPERLLNSKLAKDKRLFVTACWHPEGVDDPVKDWETFKSHLLMLRKADVPVHVMMVWFPTVIKRFPEYFKWLDEHDIRVGVRRFAIFPRWGKLSRAPILRHWLAGKIKLNPNYTKAEREYIYAYTCPKVSKYGLDMVSSYGRLCNAGKDLILVRYDGVVTLCADCCGDNHKLGNLFDANFKLNGQMIRCPTHSCGGDYGMLVLPDIEFGALPDRLWHDNFISQVEDVPDGHPVPYHRRVEMLKWLEELKREK